MRHDQAFKNLVIDFPRQAVEFFAGEETGPLPPGVRIVPLRQEQQVDHLGRRHRILDVPLLVEFPRGGREAVVFALEGESGARRFSPARLAAYCADLSELTGSTRIVPVVVFLERAPGVARWQLGTERRTYLDLTWIGCRLGELDVGPWLESDNVVARLNLVNMAHGPGEARRAASAALDGLFGHVDDERLQVKYAKYVADYAQLPEDEMAEMIEERIERKGHSPARRALEKFIRKWRREGRVEGRAVERAESLGGSRATIVRILDARGLPFSSADRDRLEAVDDLSELFRLTERAALIKDAAELFGSPPPRRRRG